MKERTFIQILFFGLVSVLAAGCSSTPSISDTAPVTVYLHPMAQVHKAAVDALFVAGFEVTKQEPAYVEGFRPRRFGMAVGSGGETVGVWLADKGPSTTEVRIDTAKSAVGLVGQKDWNDAVLKEITKSLAP